MQATYGGIGLILHPKYNRLLCAYPADEGTMTTGCGVLANKFQATELDKMMQAAVQEEFGGGLEYNEVLIDAQAMVANLSSSIAAFVFGLGGRPDVPSDPVWAYWGFAQLLRAYGLQSTPDRPLLLQADMSAKPGYVFTDVSDEADEYLRTHSLEEMPKSWEKGHAFRRGASTPEERAARRQLGRDDRSPSDNASQSSTDPLPLPDTRADDPYPTLASARAAGLP